MPDRRVVDRLVFVYFNELALPVGQCTGSISTSAMTSPHRQVFIFFMEWLTAVGL